MNINQRSIVNTRWKRLTRSFRSVPKKLWGDVRGEVNSASIILLTTILAVGAIVGLTTLRDQLVQEFGDFAAAITHLDQSYSSAYGEYEDVGPLFTDPAGDPPANLNVGN